MVFACLPNYASDGKDWANMLRNVSVNLESNGHFIDITQPLTNDPRENCERVLAA